MCVSKEGETGLSHHYVIIVIIICDRYLVIPQNFISLSMVSQGSVARIPTLVYSCKWDIPMRIM